VTPVSKLPSGEVVTGCRLRNANGLEADVISLGATLLSLRVPDRDGMPVDVVLGPERIEDYLRGRDCFGATIGRYANRIARGELKIGPQVYRLPLNSHPHCEHGGEDGFDRRLWRLSTAPTEHSVECCLISPDGDQGFPGELEVTVRYTLSDADELRIDYRATTSARTVINLTNHTYWNLGACESALSARLRIDAEFFLPVDETMLPTGEIRRVAGTPFDFRMSRVVDVSPGDARDPQMAIAGGYDHCFVLRGRAGELRTVALLEDSGSGRRLEILTTEPGMQLYTGNALSPAMVGKCGRRYHPGGGIALETQHFPDSPHHPEFPATWLAPGEVFTSTTVYRLRTSAQATKP
jgi:aldose 1-epimerase